MEHRRCLRIIGVYWADQPINLTPLFKRLPLLHTVVFDEAYGGIPWPYIQSCFRQPSIVALSITANAQWAAMPRWIRDTFPTHHDIQAVSLSQLSYSTSSWRDLLARIDEVELVDDCAVEAMCLRMLVPGMRNTAESLHLPMETAPLAQMAHGIWPRLTTLSLEGFYPNPVVSTLSSLLAQMPKLRTFSVQAAQSPESSRAPILGKDRWPQVVPVLRSLTVAYPDPQDAIFSLPSTNLTRLSLRDWPRYYISRYSRRCQLLPNSWVAPILTATECLHILERMDLPRLQSLEVVYEVDDEDERLLHRISTCYPRLSDLEIHRYRKNDHKKVVPHVGFPRPSSSSSPYC